MIGYLKGDFTVKDPTFVILDVNGVGYELKISLHTYARIKELDSGLLHTHLHVKEDAHTLYGFAEKEERQVFLMLISISGVGPNTALMINSSLNFEELKSAIVNEKVDVIQRVKGIGSKTAQRIVLELKDKLKKSGIQEYAPTEGVGSIREEAITALTTLGFNKAMAEKNVEKLLKQHGSEITVEDLIKNVLRQA